MAELQEAMAAGRLTSVALTQAYLDRIAHLDGRTNSVLAVAPMALDQARSLDAERRAGRVRGPLHGVPLLIKDNIATTDQPTTAGSFALAGLVLPHDSFLAARLREAGAVLLGKTNLSEFANW
ncbi:MAG: amidase, partial [Pseudorhodobacter sp.]|nr:amidase [Frankiaceae bacterium]